MKIQEYDAKYSPKVKKAPSVPIVASGFRADLGARSAEFQSQVEGHNQAARILEKYGRAYGTLAQGMADAKRFSDEIFGMAEKLKEARQAKKFNDGRTEMYQEIDGLLDKLPNEDQGRSRAFEFSKGAEKLRTDLINKHGLEDEFLTRFNQEFDNVAFKKWFADETDQITRAQLEYLEALPSWLAHFKEQYEAADRPETKAFFIQKAETLIRESASRGIMNSKAADDMAVAFRKQVVQTDLNNLIQNNPERAAEVVNEESCTKLGLEAEQGRYFSRKAQVAQAEARRLAPASFSGIAARMNKEIDQILEQGSRGNVLAEVTNAEAAGAVPPGTARDYSYRLTGAQEAHWTKSEYWGEPLELLYQKTAARLLPEAGTSPSEEQQAVAGYAFHYLAKDREKFVKDPATYVQPEVEKHIQQAIAAGNLDNSDGQAVIQTGLDTSWRLQRKMGAGLGIAPRILSSETAAHLESVYSEAEPEERLDMAKGLKKNFGSYAGQALREIRLPLKHQVALQKAWEENSTYLAQRLMAVIDKKDSDFALPSGLQTEDVWNRFDAAFSESDFGKYLNGLAGKFPGISAFQMGREAVYDLLGKLVFDFVEKGNRPEEATRNAVDLYTWNFKTFADEDVGFVVMPVELAQSSIVLGLEAIRKRLSEILSKKNVYSMEPVQEETGGSEHGEIAKRWIQESLWVNCGRGVYLMQPHTGKPVVNGLVFRLQDIAAVGGDLLKNRVRDKQHRIRIDSEMPGV